ncbi:hypothetical protein CLAIMM_12768 [Cladophialophora immunda]|nr:hypothetical protein CLAIMM_12768 [Cladophialophora immunda]
MDLSHSPSVAGESRVSVGSSRAAQTRTNYLFGSRFGDYRSRKEALADRQAGEGWLVVAITGQCTELSRGPRRERLTHLQLRVLVQCHVPFSASITHEPLDSNLLPHWTYAAQDQLVVQNSVLNSPADIPSTSSCHAFFSPAPGFDAGSDLAVVLCVEYVGSRMKASKIPAAALFILFVGNSNHGCIGSVDCCYCQRIGLNLYGLNTSAFFRRDH